jgi:hypothetical protein
VDIGWDALLQQALERPNEMGIEEALRPPVRRIAARTCPAVSIEDFDAFLRRLISAMGDAPRKSLIERLYILRAQLAGAKGDAVEERRLLETAWQSNPQGLDALMRLAYFALNEGELDTAERYAEELDHRIGLFHRETMRFTVAELRRFIEKERSEAQPRVRG